MKESSVNPIFKLILMQANHKIGHYIESTPEGMNSHHLAYSVSLLRELADQLEEKLKTYLDEDRSILLMEFYKLEREAYDKKVQEYLANKKEDPLAFIKEQNKELFDE